MKRTVRTLWGDMLQVALFFGIPHNALTHTTLNEFFNVQSEATASDTPTASYFCIGNRGHTAELAANKMYITESVDHYPDHAVLYEFLPFIMREVGNDISATDRQKYRMRVIKEYNGKKYICYYLKTFDKDKLTITPQYSYKDANGNVITEVYNPDSSVQKPVPPDLSNSNVIVSSNSFLSASTVIDLSLTAEDCLELLNCARVIYGDERYAYVSEYGLVSGSDVVVNGDTGTGGNIQYQEAITTQISNFLSTRGSGADDSDLGIECYVNGGAAEPLLADAAKHAIILNAAGK